MSERELHELGELQRAVLDAVWECGEATVHDVRSALAKASGREPAYTTVLTALQKLAKAGWIKHRQEGRTYFWSASRSQAEGGRSSVATFVERAFGGDPRALLQGLLSDENLTGDDLLELRRMIDAARKERGDVD